MAFLANRTNWWLLGVPLILVGAWFAASNAGEAAVANFLPTRYPALDVAETPDANAIVVLGGGGLPSEHGAAALDTPVERAAELFRAGKAPIILVSGGHGSPGRPDSSEAGQMRTALLQLGVPQNSILAEDQSANTYENAVFSSKILRARGADSIILVTPALHMARSAGAFEKAGLRIAAFSSEETLGPGDRRPRDSWLASPKDSPFHELAGIIYYRLRGWM